MNVSNNRGPTRTKQELIELKEEIIKLTDTVENLNVPLSLIDTNRKSVRM